MDVDAVLVLTSGSHAPIAIAAAEAGKHVLVEKPMCFSVAEGRAMIEAAERAGVTLMVAYNKRYDPAYRRLSEESRSACRSAPGAGDDAGIAAPALCRALPAAPGRSLAPALAAGFAGRQRRRASPRRSARPIRCRAAPIISCCWTAWCMSSTRSAASSASRIGWTSPISGEHGLTVVLRFGATQCIIAWVDLPGIARYQMELRLLCAGPPADAVVSLAVPAQHADAADHRGRRRGRAARLAHRGGRRPMPKASRQELHPFPRVRRDRADAGHLGRGCAARYSAMPGSDCAASQPTAASTCRRAV